MNIEPLIDALNHSDEQVRATAAEQLAAVGDERAIEPLIRAIQRVDTDCDVGLWAAQRALAAFGEVGLAHILAHTDEKDAFNRSLFVAALSSFEDERVFQRLITLLDDPAPIVRLRASEALSMVGKGRFLPSLLMLFGDTDQPARIRVGIGLSLFLIRNPLAIDPLLQALRDRRSQVRRIAVFALSRFKEERLIVPLMVAAHDQVARVRSTAVYALQHYAKDHTQVMDVLHKALEDQSRQVRAAAMEALQLEQRE